MNIALQKQIQIQSHTGINILAHVCVCVCVISFDVKCDFDDDGEMYSFVDAHLYVNRR